ncbi:hypothetical protein ABC383_02710 [Noviherbaspirillum sp. 1P10PC]|uniref:hypothetical protein n=1 Tax=Noviherbaspirillum sp. 1P10PC TaxID=3132292 RepID=UPI0039A12C82
MNDPDEHEHSPKTLLKTMAVAAVLAAAVSACNKSLDKPALPQPPRPHTSEASPGPIELKRAIFSVQPGDPVFYRAGEQHAPRFVIQT